MPDDLATALAGIRERHTRTRAPITGNSVTTLFASASDVPPLVAAVGAVLEAAGEAIPVVAALHCTCAAGSPDTCTCQDATAAWTLDPAKLREIITTALAGKEQDHD